MSREEMLRGIREKRLAEFNEVEKLRKSGIPPKQACEQVGMSYANYGNWRRKMPRVKDAKRKQVARAKMKRSNPTALHAIEVPAIQPARLMVFVGNPAEVMAAVRAL
jgi:hypothetical protein